VREIEMAGLKAWPGIETECDGQWVRRAAGGYSKRANSVQCLDPADGADAAARIAAARRWFEERGIDPVFRVTPLTAPAILEALRAAGWKPFDHSRTMAMDLAEMDTGLDPRAELMAPDDACFLSAQRLLQEYDEATVGKLNAVIAAIAVPAAGVMIRAEEGRPVAAALMGIADGIAIAGNVVTASTDRGRGYGRALMRSALAWAKEAGASFAALNVAADNPPALALYRSVGYGFVYDYHYARPSSP
jgi:ribosomal protein S18 acetylase RimI-like enzyme